MKKVAIITGNGELPYYFLIEAERDGYEVYPVGLFDSIDERIKKHKNYVSFSIGQISKIKKYLKKNDIKEMIMLGKVEKSTVFTNFKLDLAAAFLMFRLPDKKDETIIGAIIRYFEKSGIKVLPQNYLLGDCMTVDKIYTNNKPSKKDLQSIEIGIEAAKALTSVDAGQTVVVKDRSVVALEGIEGTDKTILRAGDLAGKGCIVIKMARPQQDLRIDIPAFGLTTMKNAVLIGAKGVVFEAEKMFFLDREEVLKIAEEHNIFIVGVKA
jgi:hypothetical protein